MNGTRAELLRAAAADTTCPVRRQQLTNAAALIAAQSDAGPLPGDVPLFETGAELRDQP